MVKSNIAKAIEANIIDAAYEEMPVIPARPSAMQIPSFNPAQTSTFRTAATTKGAVDGRLSSQWASRPDADKYLDLYTMRDALVKRHGNSAQFNIVPNQLAVSAKDDNIVLNVYDHDVKLNNWTFGQLCQLSKIPMEYARRLPAQLLAQNLQHGIKQTSDEQVKALVTGDELRAVTGAGYGRIWDYQVIDEVIKIAGNGIDETCWKVPGTIDWASSNGVTVEYNPYVDVTKETTTLYASDRDVYLFLCDDTHPIEIGKLSNGEPDLLFRGFIVQNSEVGKENFCISTMMLRGVCANRNLWGVEGQQELRMRHSRDAVSNFNKKAFPMLAAYAMSPVAGVVGKVKAAKALIVAKNDEERLEFLTGSKVGLGKGLAEQALLACFNEEGHPASSIWDMVQGITAASRKIKHQDARLDMELKAGKLMDKVS